MSSTDVDTMEVENDCPSTNPLAYLKGSYALSFEN